MIEVFKGNWNRNDVLSNPSKVFIFGDNNLRYGKGGQAIIRDIPNTLGIRTKRAPNNNVSSFYNDDDYDDNISKIKEDIENIKIVEESGRIIVFSNGGYGTGLARLSTKAPKTFEYLNTILLEYFDYTNV